MNPEILLGLLAGLAGFMLKTTLAFGICWVLSRIVASPNVKFMTWLSFLFGTGAYWLWLARGFLADGSLPAAAHYAPLPTTSSAVGAWQIPVSWGLPLGFALRTIGVFYLLVLGYFLLTHSRNQLRLRWVLRFACKPPVEIADIFRSIAESLHVDRSRLLVLSGITSPATFGWVRPTVLLPTHCLEQDRSEIEDVLYHELHHVRRWDSVSNGFAAICRALLFFHPLIWYAVRKMQFQRELACDLAVVTDSPERRAKYAECLVRFARLTASENQRVWGIDFAASSSDLKARVHAILNGSKKPSVWLLGLRTACGLALLAGFITFLPSLAVVFSYAKQHVSRPFALPASRARIESRGKAIRKVRLTAIPARTTTDAMVARVSQPQAAQPALPTPNASTYPEVVYISQSPANSDSTPQPESVPTNDPSASGGPPTAPGNVSFQKPSLTSILVGAARQISRGGDHDHDSHFR